MAVRSSFTAGEVLTAADLTDTFASKLDLAGGKILQIVRDTDTTDRSTTSTSFTDVTGLSVTITPQKSNSAILIWLLANVSSTWATGANGNSHVQITDNSNNAISGAENFLFSTFNLTKEGVSAFVGEVVSIVGYATPATTSAVTYKVRFRSNNANTTTKFENASSTAQLFAIEVSA